MFDIGGGGLADDDAAPEPMSEPWNRPDSSVRPDGYAALELQSATLDPTELSDAEVVEAVRAFEHVAAWASARQTRMLAEFARRRPPDRADAVDRATVGAVSVWAPDEIGLALTLSRGTASARIERSLRLARVLPATLSAWDAGLLDAAKVNAIHDATLCLSDTAAQVVQDRVLPKAPQQTVAQLRAALERAIIAVDPDGANARHRRAHRQRRVAVNAERDGMASLWALLSAPDALTCYGWLTALARGLPTHDPRSMDTRRADLLVALLTGNLRVHSDRDDAHAEGTDADADVNGAGGVDSAEGADTAGDGHTASDTDPTTTTTTTTAAAAKHMARQDERAELPAPVAPHKPLVHLVMPISTLTGADDSPVELTGYGPLPPALARDVAADAVWKRLVTDPLSGALLDYGRTTYRPPAALTDYLRARDQHCRVPICRRRALDSQLDHTVAFHTDSGTTSERNLYHACLCHHRMKDASGWSVTQHRDGRLTWTTPTGHRYSSAPFDYRPEPDLAAVVAALDRAAARDASGPTPPTGPSRSPFDRLTAPADDTDPPPF